MRRREKRTGLRCAWVLIGCVAFFAASARAEVVGPGVLALTPPGHIEPLRFGMLLSADAAVGPSNVTNLNAGFEVGDARLSVRGLLEKGFGYYIQANFAESTVLQDLEIEWSSREIGFRAKAGYYRTPFSGEVQIPDADIDFIERSQIVRAVAVERQIGLQLDQQILGDRLVARAGAFNGNGLDENDDQRFLYMLRFDGRIDLSDAENDEGAGRIEYGLNGGYSKDRAASLGEDLPDPFEGERWMAGADMRWSRDTLFVSAEAIYASLEPVGSTRRDVYGFQASVGWTAHPIVQVLARYDSFWAGSLTSDQDLAIASLVLNFTEYINLQTDLRVPVRGEPPRPGGLASLSIIF